MLQSCQTIIAELLCIGYVSRYNYVMDTISSYFIQQGLLGIIILVTVSVILWQQKRIDSKDKQIDELQDKRKADTDAYTASYVATTKEMVGTQKDSLNSINLMQRSLDSLTTAVQSWLNGSKGK